MDDPRIEWVKNRIFEALDIVNNKVFDEFLDRNDGEFERKLLRFLNDTPAENEVSILFYKCITEEDEEIEIPCGKQL